MVLQDRDYPDRKHHIVRTQDGYLLKVVAAYRPDPGAGELEGRVITAFLLRRLRLGDAIPYMPSEERHGD